MLLAEDLDLQALSRVLFGQAHRLAVMIAIAAGEDIFNPSDLAFELGYRAQSSIQDPLRDLVAADLISRLPKVGGRTYFQRNPSKVWAWIGELAKARNVDFATERQPHGHAEPVTGHLRGS